MDIDIAGLRILKNQLRGSNLKNLIKKKRLTKWAIARDCGLTYRTILNWEQEKSSPSDENAIVVGRYLGLISIEAADKKELENEIEQLKAKVRRLT